jgi:endo-1,4-beta-xylanase
MAERLKKAGTIDGIGMQSHLDARESLAAAFPSLSMYESAIKDYTSLGLDVQITELDATVQDRSGDKYFDVQADYYKGLFDLYEKYSDKISAVIFWGVTDTKSWRASQNPLIFDADFMAKPAFKAIVGNRTAADPVRTTRPNGSVVTTTTTTTTTTTSPIINSKLVGDANNDGGVDMADVVLIMQSLANPNKYGINGSDEHCLTLQGSANADIPSTAKGITTDDALAIQEFLLGKRSLD